MNSENKENVSVDDFIIEGGLSMRDGLETNKWHRLVDVLGKNKKYVMFWIRGIRINFPLSELKNMEISFSKYGDRAIYPFSLLLKIANVIERDDCTIIDIVSTDFIKEKGLVLTDETELCISSYNHIRRSYDIFIDVYTLFSFPKQFCQNICCYSYYRLPNYQNIRFDTNIDNFNGLFIETDKKLDGIIINGVIGGRTSFYGSSITFADYEQNSTIEYVGKKIYCEKWSEKHHKALYKSLEHILPPEMIYHIERFICETQKNLYWIPKIPFQKWSDTTLAKKSNKRGEMHVRFDKSYNGHIYVQTICQLYYEDNPYDRPYVDYKN